MQIAHTRGGVEARPRVLLSRWMLGLVAGSLATACYRSPDPMGNGDEAADSGTPVTGIGETVATAGGDTTAGTAGETGAEDEAGQDGGMRLDVSDADLPPEGCVDEEAPEYDFSYIWIANSTEGTVSKIDTATATELARYRTGPGAPDPSRTSVNLEGDVAIANRAGSITKIASREDDCVDTNGNGTIETSSGPTDILPWGEDECILWHRDFNFMQGLMNNQGGPRAVAWDVGEIIGGTDGAPCEFVPADVWVSWRDQPTMRSLAWKLDGENGDIVTQVELDGFMGEWMHGTYGGATDANGDFWGVHTRSGLFRVSALDDSVTRWTNPSGDIVYGMALDEDGNPWMSTWEGKLWQFDVTSETWSDQGVVAQAPVLRGMAIDDEGHAWIAGNAPCSLVRYDTKAKAVVDDQIALPGCDEPVGVSVDVDGFVWVVDRRAQRAFKVDPSTYAVEEVTGLVDPYTYSDMTGAGLRLVNRTIPG